MTYTGPGTPTGPTHPAAPGGSPYGPGTPPWGQHPAAPPAPGKPGGAAPGPGNWGYPSAAAAAYVNATTGANASAHAIILGFLQRYGLESLATWAWNQYLALGGGPDAINQIQFELPDQPAFKTRFPAYAALAKAGHAMTPGDMIALENSYTAALHGAGLPAGFYDHPDDFAKFMLDQVSPAEVAQRAQIAATVVLQDDPETRRQLGLLGVSAGHQIAWILDPGRALPFIQNTVLAAQDAAAGVTTGFGQLTRAQSAALAQQGVTADQARSTFSQLGQEAGLFAGTAAEGTNISQQEQLNAAFAGNRQAQQRIAQRAAQRTADYKGGSGFGVTQSGVVGLGVQT